MPQEMFKKRKLDILNKSDKSSKGDWDKKIAELCNKINSYENYYTTSSCSGRVVLMIDQDKKEKDLFLKIYHNLIRFNQLKSDLNNIIKLHSQAREINGKQLSKKISLLTTFKKFRAEDNERGNLIKFKLEPCILHIACRTIDDAKKLCDYGKKAGWKRSGIIGFSGKNTRVMVELNSTEKFEFPIIEKEKLLVDDVFLKIIVQESSKKLKKSWEKIEKLRKLLK